VQQDEAGGLGLGRFAAWMTAARMGNPQALGNLLEAFKPYLLGISCRALPATLRGKYDDADLVQETLLEACRCFARFEGQSTDDLRLWLRGILIRNLLDCVRRYCNTCKRALSREQSLDAYLDFLEPVVPDQTPCARAVAQENLAALRCALKCLPADEQLIIELRNFDCLSFREIGQRLCRSPEAARKLWSRALARLEGLLARQGIGLEP
jgi:RNA polymerase sigma-70 factor, ECF subfamily